MRPVEPAAWTIVPFSMRVPEDSTAAMELEVPPGVPVEPVTLA